MSENVLYLPAFPIQYDFTQYQLKGTNYVLYI